MPRYLPEPAQRIRHAIAAATDRRQLEVTFTAAIRGYGFTAYAAGFVPDGLAEGASPPDPLRSERPQPFLLLHWPPAWLELYARQGFAAEDITVTEATGTSEPFTWSEVRRKRPGASERIFAAALRFGWSDGLVIPVHDPTGRQGERFGLINLAAQALERFGPAARASVTEVALAAFGAARLFALATPPAPAEPRLSARECEVLAFVAAGLSDEAVAERLHISRSTAHHHVENVKRKLSAASRAQAVAIALTNNLI